MADIDERVAILETQHKGLAKNQDKILEELGELKGTVKKYHGFVAGMLFVVNALWIVATGIFAFFNRHG